MKNKSVPSVEKEVLTMTWGNTWAVSKVMTKMYGFELAGFFNYLVAHHQHIKEQITRKDGYFFIESQKVEDAVGLYYKQQYNILNVLEKDFKLIKTQVLGNPPKKYIWIDYAVYKQLLSEKLVVPAYLTKGERERRKLDKVPKPKREKKVRVKKTAVVKK